MFSDLRDESAAARGRRKRFTIIASVVAVTVTLAHFLLTSYAFTQAELIHPTAESRAWGEWSEVLTQPFAQAARGIINSLLMLFLVNSALWGASVGALIYWVLQRLFGTKPRSSDGAGGT